MSAMSDLDVTLQLGEVIGCDCGSDNCQSGAVVEVHDDVVTLEVTGSAGKVGSIVLSARTAAALAILLDEASRDAAGD